MNADEVFGVENAVLVLEESREKLDGDRCSRPLWEAGNGNPG